MDSENGTNHSGVIEAFRSLQARNQDYTALLQQACSAFSSFGCDLAKVSLPPADCLQILGHSTNRMTDACLQAFQNTDYSSLLSRCADTIRRFSIPQSVELSQIISASLQNIPNDRFLAYANQELTQSYLSALEHIKVCVPEDTREEIQEKVIEPAKKEKCISIDTLLSIISIVLTILIFLYEQTVNQDYQRSEDLQVAELHESVQQLTDEISELSGVIQQLTNEVGELSDQSQCTAETALDAPNMDNKPN